MIWIDNYAIPRQYFDNLVKARKMAIAWLEEHPRDTQVFFYPNKNSKNYKAYVFKEKIHGKNYYYWYPYTK